MLKVLIVAACFVFAGMVVNYSTHGRLFGTLIPDPPAASSPRPSPSVVRVLIGSQVWTCRMERGNGEGCTLTYSPSARLRP